MSDPWPKTLRDVSDRWDNESLTLPPVGTRCRLVLTTHEGIPAEHLERDGKEVEIIAHIANGNLAVCACYEHWARNDDGEWWVGAFNDRQFQPIKEPFWPSVNEGCRAASCSQLSEQPEEEFSVEPLDAETQARLDAAARGLERAMRGLPRGGVTATPETGSMHCGKAILPCEGCGSVEGQYHAPECPLVNAFTAGRIGAKKRSKYHREIKPGVFVDVYDVLNAWAVTNPALQHLLKKALQPGGRGHKDLLEDLDDIIDSAKRAKELES